MSDDATFADFVATRWARLYRLAFLLTGSPATAEDLVQTALEKAYVHWGRVWRTDDPDAYVRRILVTTMASSRRRLSWRREVLDASPPDTGIPSAEDLVTEHAALWPLVCALPERQRAVIVLRYYEDLTEEQIATTLGCSRGTVKSQASDALRALRRSAAYVSLADDPAGAQVADPIAPRVPEVQP